MRGPARTRWTVGVAALEARVAAVYIDPCCEYISPLHPGSVVFLLSVG
jgi:hypothetical protein